MIEKIFILSNFVDDQAVLIEVNKNKKVFWPQEYLPKDIKIGETININICLKQDLVDRKILAKDVLNEILDIGE